MSEAMQGMVSQETTVVTPSLEIDPGPPETENNVVKKKRKNRPFNNEEVILAQKFHKLAIEYGEDPIPYSALELDMKRAVLPTTKVKLIAKGLLEPNYDLDIGTVESVTLDLDVWEDFKDQLVVVEPPVVAAPPRKSRYILGDEKYRLKKLVKVNPRKDGTHGFHNWQHCYHDNMSVRNYLRFMDYPRDIVVKSRYGEAWFNGPSTIYLQQDVKNKAIGIYDSTLDPAAPGYWIRHEDMVGAYAAADLEEETENSENGETSRVTPEMEFEPVNEETGQPLSA